MEQEEVSGDRIRRDAAEMGVSLPGASGERLARFTRLLEERAASLGLVARSDSGRMYERHVLDSLRAAALLRRTDALAYDLGSGAGLPGVVLAATAPWCRVVLIEPRRIRVGFLEMALELLDLPNAHIATVRAESVEKPADLATARAFAPLEKSWQVAGPLLRPGGRLVYFAGEGMSDPLASARAAAHRHLPATVAVAKVLATSPPLVIMARK